jgi:hypothetical protein
MEPGLESIIDALPTNSSLKDLRGHTVVYEMPLTNLPTTLGTESNLGPKINITHSPIVP